MVADHLVDDEAQELLGEVRVELGLLREPPQPRNLRSLPLRVGRGQAGGRLVGPDLLGHLEPLGEHVDKGGIDVVDAPAIVPECVRHVTPPPHFRDFPALRPRRPCLRSVRPIAGTAMTATIPSAQILPLRGAKPSLASLMALVAPGLNAVNRVILDRMQSEVALIPELAGHLIAGGGKRLRPMLTLGSAAALDYAGDRHHRLAAAVEFIHTATLLHDDVVDGSDLRRGRKTANIIWGNGASVLVGDFLFSRAFELMVEDGSLKVLKILSRASAVIAEGEVAQLTAQRVVETTEDRYLAIISAKTAALFAAACEIAAVVAERGPAIESVLESYGRNLGIAFQLVDDAIDYVSDAATMGKDAGDDFRDGKVTLPVILAHARGDAAARRFWARAMRGEANGPDALAEAIARLEETSAIDDTLARARLYGSRALDALAVLPETAARAALAETVAFAIDRAY